MLTFIEKTNISSKSRNRYTAFRIRELKTRISQRRGKKRGLSNGQAVQIVLHEALSGFERKQEILLRQLNHMDDHFELLAKVSALAAITGELQLDAKQHDVAELREKLKIHFKHSSGIGDSI